MSMPRRIIASDQAKAALIALRATNALGQADTVATADTDERHYLNTELLVRTSRYWDIEASLGSDCSPWMRGICLCMRDLFTNPEAARLRLDTLLAENTDLDVRERLETWRCHVTLLVGNINEGSALFASLNVNPLQVSDSIWAGEVLIVRSLCAYALGRSRLAIELAEKAMDAFQDTSDLFFQAFAASMGERAALKVSDAQKFEFFSRVMLKIHAQGVFDARYLLRQHGYRAMILTQLGERELATKYWHAGDELLPSVDAGGGTVERCQFLMLRCLAAALLGDEGRSRDAFIQTQYELEQTGGLPTHRAELNTIRILAPLTQKIRAGIKLRATYQDALAAEGELLALEEAAGVEAVRDVYSEARRYLSELLDGSTESPLQNAHAADRYFSLSISLLDNFGRSAVFAGGIDHFRLIPNFVRKLQKTGLSDEGLAVAIESALGVRPWFKEGVFGIDLAGEALTRDSESSMLLFVANTLCDLKQRADKQAQAVAVSQLTQMVVHDVRKPFSKLRAGLQMLEGVESDAEFRCLLPRIVAEVDASTASVNALLADIMEVGKATQLQLERCAPQALIKTCLDEQMRAASTAQATFQYDFRHTSLAEVDQHKIGRVLANLIENALQASPPQARLWLKTREYEAQAGRRIEFCIGNAGSFVAQEERERIFETFYTRGKLGGTGLGLAIAKKIVEEHGGSIWCRSEQDLGTELLFTVPASSQACQWFGHLPADTHKMRRQSHDEPSNHDLGKLVAAGSKAVAILDDDPFIAEAWTASLKREAIVVHAFSQPAELRQRLANDPDFFQNVELVVLDYYFGTCAETGLDLVRYLRDQGASKVALASDVEISTTDRHKFDAIIGKVPMGIDQLRAAVTHGITRFN